MTSWIGRVARLFLAQRLPQVVTTASLPQVVAAISTQPSLPSRLMVLGETPAAPPPPRPRRVRRVTQLEVDQVALGPGIHG